MKVEWVYILVVVLVMIGVHGQPPHPHNIVVFEAFSDPACQVGLNPSYIQGITKRFYFPLTGGIRFAADESVHAVLYQGSLFGTPLGTFTVVDAVGRRVEFCSFTNSCLNWYVFNDYDTNLNCSMVPPFGYGRFVLKFVPGILELMRIPQIGDNVPHNGMNATTDQDKCLDVPGNIWTAYVRHPLVDSAFAPNTCGSPGTLVYFNSTQVDAGVGYCEAPGSTPSTYTGCNQGAFLAPGMACKGVAHCYCTPNADCALTTDGDVGVNVPNFYPFNITTMSTVRVIYGNNLTAIGASSMSTGTTGNGNGKSSALSAYRLEVALVTIVVCSLLLVLCVL